MDHQVPTAAEATVPAEEHTDQAQQRESLSRWWREEAMKALLHVCALLLAVPLLVGGGQPSGAAALQQRASPRAPLGRIEATSTIVFHEARQALFMETLAGVSLSKVLAFSVFGAFRPGISIDEARARFGSPVRSYSEGHKKVAVYETSSAQVDVADELSGSGCASYHRRTLYAYPKAGSGCGLRVSELLDAQVAEQIPGTTLTEVGLAEARQGGERVWVLVEDGCVKALNWWTPNSQP